MEREEEQEEEGKQGERLEKIERKQRNNIGKGRIRKRFKFQVLHLGQTCGFGDSMQCKSFMRHSQDLLSSFTGSFKIV